MQSHLPRYNNLAVVLPGRSHVTARLSISRVALHVQPTANAMTQVMPQF